MSCHSPVSAPVVARRGIQTRTPLPARLRVLLVGGPNVGKSTLVNALVGRKITIVTAKPQTTRHRILGVVTRPEAQLVLVDTPGLHESTRRVMNQYMNRVAISSSQDADVILFVIEAMQFTDEDMWVWERVRGLKQLLFLVILTDGDVGNFEADTKAIIEASDYPIAICAIGLGDGPFTKIDGLLAPPAMSVIGPSNPAGYLISHRINNSFVLINRLLKANAEVYWLKKQEMDLGTGAIWVPASAAARPVLERGAKELGVAVHAVAKAPAGEALKLKPIRIGLCDQYGGSMTSGWTRWLFEQYEFPFEVVYPPALDAGDLKSKFDVLVMTDGAIRLGGGGGGGGGRGGGERITEDKTVPQLKKFVESGGSIVTIGSSTSVAEWFGIPVKNYLAEEGPDGKDRPLPREKFYIPGALLRADVDNTKLAARADEERASTLFVDSVRNAKVSREIEQAILDGYDRLVGREGVSCLVAVRSSALGEDELLSFAGQ